MDAAEPAPALAPPAAAQARQAWQRESWWALLAYLVCGFGVFLLV